MLIRIIAEWIFVLLEMIIGLMRLSTNEEAKPKKITPIAEKLFPPINRKIATHSCIFYLLLCA